MQILAKKLQRLQQKISKEEASAGGMKIELQACHSALHMKSQLRDVCCYKYLQSMNCFYEGLVSTTLLFFLQAKLRKVERQVKASKRSLDTLTSAYELLNAGLNMREGQYKSMERTVSLSLSLFHLSQNVSQKRISKQT